MDQRIMIYIILSAILLYLYYRKQDITVLAAFIVVVSTTLIFGKDVREGAKNKGGGGGDKECKKFGFIEPKIDKEDIVGSLDKVMKNIVKVAKTYWGFENGDIEGKVTEDKTLEQSWATIKGTKYMKSIWDGKNQEDTEILSVLFIPAFEIFEKFALKKTPDDEKEKMITEKIMPKLDETIKGIAPALEILKKIKNSDDMKEADEDAKNLLKYIICLTKHWISIFKALQKANG